jgi:hypothetical protein
MNNLIWRITNSVCKITWDLEQSGDEEFQEPPRLEDPRRSPSVRDPATPQVKQPAACNCYNCSPKCASTLSLSLYYQHHACFYILEWVKLSCLPSRRSLPQQTSPLYVVLKSRILHPNKGNSSRHQPMAAPRQRCTHPIPSLTKRYHRDSMSMSSKSCTESTLKTLSLTLPAMDSATRKQSLASSSMALTRLRELKGFPCGRFS